jgi:hypothetical protein
LIPTDDQIAAHVRKIQRAQDCNFSFTALKDSSELGQNQNKMTKTMRAVQYSGYGGGAAGLKVRWLHWAHL